MRSLFTIISHTLRKQMRSANYLLVVALSIFLAFLCVPGANEGYQIFYLGGVRGIYNSAWLGYICAMLPVILLWLPGFYLLRSQILEDGRLKIGQSISSSPVRKIQYIGSKFLSNLVVLVSYVLLFTFAVMLMQLFRRESMWIQLRYYFEPFIFITMPYLLILAALTVLFDVIPALRGVFGNIAIFFIWVTSASISVALPDNSYDLFGIGYILNQMLESAKNIYPNLPDSASFGYYQNSGTVPTFVWNGVTWDNGFLAARLMWVGTAALLVLLTSIVFDRFQTPQSRTFSIQPYNNTIKQHTPRNFKMSPVKTSRHVNFLTMLKGELTLLLTGRSFWWYAAVFFSIISSYFVVMGEGLKWISLIMLFPLGAWSQMGCRENYYNTEQFAVSSCPRATKWIACLTAGIVMGLVISSGIMLRFTVNRAWGNLIAWALGVMFVSVLALTCGTFSKTSRLFEGLFIILLYLGPINNIGRFDFLGVQSQWKLFYLFLFLILLLVGIALQWSLDNIGLIKSMKRSVWIEKQSV